jgi:hypothetical protein
MVGQGGRYVCDEAYCVVFVDGADGCESFDETSGVICGLMLFDSNPLVQESGIWWVRIGVGVFKCFECFEVSTCLCGTPG